MERKKTKVNNAFYDTLNDTWSGRDDHPIALLLAENRVRTPWIADQVQKEFDRPCNILDIGCGGGHLSNHLATMGHQLSGIDLSEPSLSFAKSQDTTHSVAYEKADACHLPFEENQFDVVCAMDLLEHVDHPKIVIEEASRVLKPGGLFFFHTFNRTILSYLLIIKAVEWFIPNTPKNLHVFSHFITPKEMKNWCQNACLHVNVLQGFIPDSRKKSFWRTALTRTVSEEFSFRFSSSLSTGYVGIAKKTSQMHNML
jgi:2-polyprenyl-6-hydroxyphenyl methylase/3-demethylubiquinone-9 3-methyltransferase